VRPGSRTLGACLATVLGLGIGVLATGGGAPVRATAAPASPVLAPAAIPAPPVPPPAPPPAPVRIGTDRPSAAELASARADAEAGDPGGNVPELAPLPEPGYAKPPPPASFVVPLAAPISVVAAPGGPVESRLADPTPKGEPLTLLVLGHSPDGAWTHVALEQRPNGSTGWVRSADVVERPDPWRIDVLAGRHRVLVWYGDSLLANVPVATGAPGTPTPYGTFFVDTIVDTGDPAGPYGRWILGLAAHSDAYATFNGGDALIALHGTNEPDSIGHSASHGCVRMARPLAALLVHLVPLGTQVRILR